MKKLIACLLALAMIFALAACGNTPDPTDPSGSTAGTTAATDPKPTETKPTEPPHVHADENTDGICDGCAEVLSLTLTGSADVLDPNTGATQYTIAELNLNLVENTATLDLIMPIEGVGNMYFMASEMGTDPETSWLYMMAQIIGVGTVTEADGGYKVSFAWNVESLNEETGETVVTPMTMEMTVTEADGVYSAVVNYIDYLVITVDSIVKLSGSADVIDPNTGAAQYTIANLNLNLINKTATLDIVMPIEGVGDMYYLASEMGTDPATSWLYMMAQIIGVGTVTETEGGYVVSFAWNVESLNEETGETVVTPLAMDVTVTVADGAYTAVVNYFDYMVINVAD